LSRPACDAGVSSGNSTFIEGSTSGTAEMKDRKAIQSGDSLVVGSGAGEFGIKCWVDIIMAAVCEGEVNLGMQT
jgi:hypothetical protein